MQHHYVNRKSRMDRHFLWRGAMAAQGVPVRDMTRHIAKDKDDYSDVQSLCEAARADFPEFFSFHLESPQSHIGFGHLICSWSVMRMWRSIASGNETACAWLDDYALRVPQRDVVDLITGVDAEMVMLAWHERPDIFDENVYGLPASVLPPLPKCVSRVPQVPSLFRGALGGSDWAIIFSPAGAGAVLQFMADMPYFNTELAPVAYYFTRRSDGVFSVRGNDAGENGTVPLRRNRWVVHLWDYTDGETSDLIGLHEGVSHD